MQDFLILRTIDQIRSIAHAERIKVIEATEEKALTATMIAAILGGPVNRVHYHVRQLLGQGLLEETEGAGRHRKAERFYRATARHFLVDPRLGCTDAEVAASVERSIESASLDWRRREILDLDFGPIARRVVEDCLRVARGDRVLVAFVPAGFELAEALLVEATAAGAEAIPKIWSRNVVFRTLDRNDPESLEQLPFLHPAQDKDLAAVILITSSLTQGGPPNEEQRKKLPLVLTALDSWQQSLRERRVRYLEIRLPHRAEFEQGQNSPGDSIDMFWQCLDADYKSIHTRGSEMLKRVGEGRRVKLTCHAGTNLVFDLEPGSLHVSDGILSPEDIAAGFSSDGLPSGALSGLPTPEGAKGVLYSDYTFVAGTHFSEVRIVLENGKITELDAKNDVDKLRSLIAQESGTPGVFSGFVVGLNQGGSGLTGKPILDACFAGVVTAGFGNNTQAGGHVKSTLALNLPCRSLSAEVDGLLVVEDGTLKE